LDFRYDGAIGAWLEASASRFTEAQQYVPAYGASACVGMDYVVGWGDGLAFTLENMIIGFGKDDLAGFGRETFSSALLMRYPLGLLDTVSILVLKDWDQDLYAVNTQWRRAYDYLSIDLNAGRTITPDYHLGLSISINL